MALAEVFFVWHGDFSQHSSEVETNYPQRMILHHWQMTDLLGGLCSYLYVSLHFSLMEGGHSLVPFSVPHILGAICKTDVVHSYVYLSYLSSLTLLCSI